MAAMFVAWDFSWLKPELQSQIESSFISQQAAWSLSGVEYGEQIGIY